MKKILIFLAIALTVCLAFSACGDKKTDTNDGGFSSGSVEENTTEAPSTGDVTDDNSGNSGNTDDSNSPVVTDKPDEYTNDGWSKNY